MRTRGKNSLYGNGLFVKSEYCEIKSLTKLKFKGVFFYKPVLLSWFP